MKKWQIKNVYQQGTDVISQLLNNRGIENTDEFLNTPDLEYYLQKFPQNFLESLEQAKQLILESILSNNPIVIHGDYDCDGITATAILFSTINNELSYSNVFYFIPNRFDHGYGLSQGSIDTIISQVREVPDNKDRQILFITVDSGITAVEQVAYLKKLNCQVIITDHHQKPETLPPADLIVWNDTVVGATISYLLSRVLGSENVDNLSYASLATVTDLQPLLNFNRSLVKSGLEAMNTQLPLGIQKLLQVAGRKEGEITSYDLGWVLGPRLNASGRLFDAMQSLALLLETEEDKAMDLAIKLNAVNVKRQDKTLEMYGLAQDFSTENVPKMIITQSDEYHEGIIGLVAAKLVQKFYRPSVVISLNDVHGKGSVRSIPGFDVIAFLRRFQDLFVNIGGHPMAAGFTIEKNKIEVLKQRVAAEIDQHLSEELLVPYLDIDMSLPLNQVTLSLVEEVEKLKPFGLGNEEPVFVSTKAKIIEQRLMGKENQHLMLKVFDGANSYKAVYFQGAPHFSTLKFGDEVDLVYTPKINQYMGRTSIDLIVKDLKLSTC